jgi:hypothetical protein
MRLILALFLIAVLDARAQFGVGITIPAGRSTHRPGTVPDSMATYAVKELDVRPRCTVREESWISGLVTDDSCATEQLGSDCRQGESVTIRFIVERDGSVSDLFVVKGGCPSLPARLRCGLGHAPRWEPGRIGYHKVRTRMQLRTSILLR